MDFRNVGKLYHSARRYKPEDSHLPFGLMHEAISVFCLLTHIQAWCLKPLAGQLNAARACFGISVYLLMLCSVFCMIPMWYMYIGLFIIDELLCMVYRFILFYFFFLPIFHVNNFCCNETPRLFVSHQLGMCVLVPLSC
jgi:hypothetical protein